jgi:hypothetical protein
MTTVKMTRTFIFINDSHFHDSVLNFDIITSIAASPKGRPGILMILFVENFERDVIAFIGIKLHNVTPH